MDQIDSIVDIAVQVSHTVGLGAFALEGTFVDVLDGSRFEYTARNLAKNNEFEKGLGVYSAGALSLTRGAVKASSNHGDRVNFSAGPKEISVEISLRTYIEARTQTAAAAAAGNSSRVQTTDNTPAQLSAVALSNNSAVAFNGRIIAREAATGDSKTWQITGSARRGANAATTALVNPTQTQTMFRRFGIQLDPDAEAIDPDTQVLGTRFQVLDHGVITALRYYRSANDTTPVGRTAYLYTDGGVLIASVAFSGDGAIGWHEQALAVPLNIDAGIYVVALLYADLGGGSHWPRTQHLLDVAFVNDRLIAINGRFETNAAAGTFPTNLGSTGVSYFADVVFSSDAFAYPTIGGASAWRVDIQPDTANGTVAIIGTGENGKTIDWLSSVEAVAP